MEIDYIEIIAAVLGLIGIFLQIKQHPLYWLTSILMVSLYIYVFYNSKFYADMSFQFYYLVISIYGWTYWIKDTRLKKINSRTENVNINIKIDKPQKLSVKKLKLKHLFISIIISLVLWVLIYIILDRFTNSDVALGDSFTTALSIVATFLLARKYIENWIFWIIVDFISTILYVSKGLYPTAILFIVLTILAFVGFFKWKNRKET